MHILRFQLASGYGNKPEATVYIDGIKHRIDTEHLKNYIEKAMTEKGYTVSQTKRQVYPRVTLND